VIGSGRAYPFLGAIAAWGAFINLFNLLPVYPLDGGRVLNALSFSIGNRFGSIAVIGSLLLGLVLAFVMEMNLLLLAVVIGLSEFMSYRFADRFRSALHLIGAPRLYGSNEHEHFYRYVCPTDESLYGSVETEKRRGEIRNRLQEVTIEPMNPKQFGLSVLTYMGLGGVLSWIIWHLSSLPGAGGPLNFLK
jgi:membrane-associated protease RseP (regulator of RpoE activity)